MPSAKQYSLYPGAYAPIPIPQISVPSPVSSTTNIYSDLGMDVGFIASMGEGGGEGAESVATAEGSMGSFGAQAATGLASNLGSAIAGPVGGVLGAGAAGAAIGGTNTAAGAMAKGAVQAALTAINPMLGIAYGVTNDEQSALDAFNAVANALGFAGIAAPVSSPFGSEAYGAPFGMSSDPSYGVSWGPESFGTPASVAPDSLAAAVQGLLGESPAEGGLGGSEGGFGDSTGDGTGGGFGAGSVGASGEGE